MTLLKRNSVRAALKPAPNAKIDEHEEAAAQEAEVEEEQEQAPAKTKLTDTSRPFTPPVQSAAAASQAIATRAPTTVQAGSQEVSTHVVPSNNDADFDDLEEEVGYGSFKGLKLDKDKFVSGSISVDEITCVIQRARKKWVYKLDDDHLCYSYDQLTNANNGRLLTEIEDEWREALDDQTTPVVISKYYEAQMYIRETVPSSELQGELVLGSIPPASVKRFSGHQALIKARTGGLQLNKVVTRIKKGDLIKISPKISFYPWDFSFVEVLGNSV